MSKKMVGRDDVSAVCAGAPVAWIGGARGPDEDAEIVREAIVEHGQSQYGPLVAAVAERLFARDNARVGNVADIGFFHSWYTVAARHLIDRLVGACLAVDSIPSARHADRL